MEPYYVDFIFIAIILFFAWRGYKNGILSGIICIASTVIAGIGGTMFSPALSPIIGSFISPIIKKALLKSPETYLEAFIPSEYVDMFSKEVLAKGQDAILVLSEELTNRTQDIIAFLIIFAIIVIVANAVLRFITLKLPFISAANRLLGLAFGGFAGCVIVFVLISVIAKYIDSSDSAVTLAPYFKNSYFVKTIAPIFQTALRDTFKQLSA